MRAPLLFSISLVFGAACASDPDVPDGSVDGGVIVNGDTGVAPVTLEFETQVISGLNTASLAGDNAVAKLAPSGQPAVAYGFVPTGSTDREIRYSERGSDGTWSDELVVRPGANAPSGGDLVGLGLAFVGGAANVVYLGGDDDGELSTPYPTDLMLSTRGAGGAWSERMLVNASGDTPGVCPDTQNTCNVGQVVGSHAAIAAGPGSAFAVVYRDTHFGFGRDDLALADVELFEMGGTVGRAVIDPVRSGGAYANVVYGAGGTPVVAYNLEEPVPGQSRTGVWAAFWDGAAWQLRQVSQTQTSAKIGLGAASDGTLYLAYYHTDDADLVVATSEDGGDTWTSERVDTTGKTGLHPSLAVDAEDRPVVAYTYCGPTSERNCPSQLGANARVRVARKEAGGWQIHEVDDGQGFGGVGFFTAVVIDSDGKIGVAFQDARNNDLLYSKEQ